MSKDIYVLKFFLTASKVHLGVKEIFCSGVGDVFAVGILVFTF